MTNFHPNCYFLGNWLLRQLKKISNMIPFFEGLIILDKLKELVILSIN